MPVHVYGNMCDTGTIRDIAEKHNLKVIYDAAHAFAVKSNGKSSACFGNASMFSFHATKVFNSIEGGAICTDDDSLVQKLNDTKNFGIRGTEECVYNGGNAKMNEFQAAMGICNLRHLKEEIAKRKKVVEKYKDELGSLKGIKLCHTVDNIEPNYSYFPVVFEEFKYSRNEVYERLEANEIGSRKYFYPLTNEFECNRSYPNANVEATPVAKYIADRVLTLPLYADLDVETVEKICKIIKE